MKKLFILCLLAFAGTIAHGQYHNDSLLIVNACNGYFDGFYKGDTAALKAAISPELYKIGYYKQKDATDYAYEGQMTFEKAMNYSKNVLKSKRFVSEKAPRTIEVLDIMHHIAAAKITAWWGTDYMMLVREGDKWVIREVIWEGPLQKP